ncbi:hypothetical protein RDWZM_007982 [Blomia tropicalis]|uniref:N-acetylglucosaminylphosphatidylinositol deacetylase n=1 Tax=Blomia tropicalis TaxID=40697 RepID=A0A9Q0M042_BLOTA|nr:hypothetical protein RDWZM_007982 [Blomia tropicalis]
MTLLLVLFIPIIIGWLLLRPQPLSSVIDIKQNVLFVIAHPDDESMFFGPTLLREIRERIRQPSIDTTVHLLCLSHGNFYGDGKKRFNELTNACQYLVNYCSDFNYTNLNKNKPSFVLKVIDDEYLPDSPNVQWSDHLIRKYVIDYVKVNDIGKIITFDSFGISGHSNHVAIHLALSDHQFRNSSTIQIWQLLTVPLWRKYLSLFDLFITYQNDGEIVHRLSFTDYWNLVETLRHHRSQMLWFRYLYAVTSRYMFINTLNCINN